jgi:Fe-S cluster assembly iron-binding protein IscA
VDALLTVRRVSMIRITAGAKSRLKRINFNRVKKAGLILRLALNNGGQLGLLAGKEQISDEVHREGGKKILLIAQQLAAILNGCTLDIRDTKEGRVLYMLH